MLGGQGAVKLAYPHYETSPCILAMAYTSPTTIKISKLKPVIPIRDNQKRERCSFESTSNDGST